MEAAKIRQEKPMGMAASQESSFGDARNATPVPTFRGLSAGWTEVAERQIISAAARAKG